MLKEIVQFLKNSGFKVTHESDKMISGYDIKTLLVISAISTNHILICKENEKQVKFEGIIDNIQQLKMILNCIKKAL